MEQEQKRRRGNPREKQFARYSVTLDPDLAEWARDEPEGLSGLIRDALSDIRSRRQAGHITRNKLWALFPVPKTDGEKYYEWDTRCCMVSRGFVVSAETEELARYVAGANAAEEGGSVWTDPDKTSCDRLYEGEDTGRVLGNFMTND